MAPESETRRTLGGLSGPMRGRTDRRTFLKGAGLALAAGAAGSELTPVIARAASQRGAIPLKHVIVDCQENRSFDHYYGFAPFAGRFGVPAGREWQAIRCRHPWSGRKVAWVRSTP